MQPKISCICPTRGRFETLRESISFFLLQDYPNKELIIFKSILSFEIVLEIK
jgi:glycosyltransferase involved in cell wall biosynthesis